MAIDLTRFGLRLGPRQPHRSARPEVVGVAIGAGDDGTLVRWPSPTREASGHLAVFAGSGAGKTVLVAAGLVAETASSLGDVPSLFVVDPKGDLVEHLLMALAAHAPERLGDVIYLDPFAPGGGFPLNLNLLDLGSTPLDIRAMQLANLVAEVSTATGSQRHLGVGARQLDVLTNVILGALAVNVPGASVLLALDSLADQRSLKLLGTVTEDERAKQFLLTAQLGDELRVSCASRLRTALAASSSLAAMVSAPGCIQFGELTAPRRIVLVDLGRPIGGMTALSVLFSNLVVRLAIEHLMERRSPWQGHHCRIVVDEAQVVAPALADRAEAVLTTGRSRGLSIATITQGTVLLASASDALLQVLLTNSPTKLVGRLAARDAELLARDHAPSRGVDETLGAFRSRLAAAVTTLEDREFFCLRPGRRQRFRSAEVDLRAWHDAAAIHAETIDMVKTNLVLSPPSVPRLSLSMLAARRSSAGTARSAPTAATATRRSRRSPWG